MAEPSLFGFNGIEHKIGDTTFKFRCVSGKTLFKLKGLAEPVIQAIAFLFEDTKDDKGHKSIKTSDKTAEGATERDEFEVPAADPKVLEFRAARADKIAKTLSAAMSDEKNLLAICEVIHDSIRKDQPDAFKSGQDIMESVPLPALVAMAVGVAAANKELFSPLAAQLAPRLGEKFPSAAASVAEVLAPENATAG